MKINVIKILDSLFGDECSNAMKHIERFFPKPGGNV